MSGSVIAQNSINALEKFKTATTTTMRIRKKYWKLPHEEAPKCMGPKNGPIFKNGEKKILSEETPLYIGRIQWKYTPLPHTYFGQGGKDKLSSYY